MATIPLALTRLMENVRIHLPGALDDAIRLELFNTADEFFKYTRSWQEDIVFETGAGETSYEIDPDEDGTIISLLAIENASETPVRGTMAVPGIVILDTEPSQVEELTATVALTVVDPVRTDDYPRLPDWFLTKYYDAVLDGLLSRMMLQPAKPYTNERLALLRGRTWRAKLASAKAEALHKNRQGGQTWRFPSYA